MSIVISVHGDTNWMKHSMLIRKAERNVDDKVVEENEYYGHMDNFAGVYTVMKAFFSGQIKSDRFRLEITYGEEIDMEGAKNVAKTILPCDIVIVVDVTGTPTTKNLVIEKCRNKRLRKYVDKILISNEVSYDLHVDCPDPIANEDETNVYGKITDFTFFFGIPTRGGDYNDGPVLCYQSDIEKCSSALVTLVNGLHTEFPFKDIEKEQKRGASSVIDHFSDISVSFFGVKTEKTELNILNNEH